MADFKAYCTRRMREVGVIDRDRPAWAHHGSTRYIKTPESLSRAIAYVLHEQGDELAQRVPGGWIGDVEA